jgi:hypothetical protein
LWRCNGGFGPRTTQNHLRKKQIVSGTWNSSRVSACALRNEQADRGRPVRFAAHRQPLYWNFMYHSRIVLSVGGSVWYVFRNLRCTVTIDSVLANSNAFLFPVDAMFRHDCPLAVNPASTPRRLRQKIDRFSTNLYAPLRRDHSGYCTAEVGNPGGTYELLCIL